MSKPIVLDYDVELSKSQAIIDGYFQKKSAKALHERYRPAFDKLTDDQKVHGTLPAGFLYCLHCTPRSPFVGLVRFFGFAPREASGNCLDCRTTHTIHVDGTIITRDTNGKILCVLPGCDDDLWQHVRGNGK